MSFYNLFKYLRKHWHNRKDWKLLLASCKYPRHAFRPKPYKDVPKISSCQTRTRIPCKQLSRHLISWLPIQLFNWLKNIFKINWFYFKKSDYHLDIKTLLEYHLFWWQWTFCSDKVLVESVWTYPFCIIVLLL